MSCKLLPSVKTLRRAPTDALVRRLLSVQPSVRVKRARLGRAQRAVSEPCLRPLHLGMLEVIFDETSSQKGRMTQYVVEPNDVAINSDTWPQREQCSATCAQHAEKGGNRGRESRPVLRLQNDVSPWDTCSG